MIDHFKTIKMVDVIHLTTDNRTVILPSHNEPRPDTAFLLAQPGLALPSRLQPNVSTIYTSQTAM